MVLPQNRREPNSFTEYIIQTVANRDEQTIRDKFDALDPRLHYCADTHLCRPAHFQPGHLARDSPRRK